MIEGIAIGLFLATTVLITMNIILGIKARRIAEYEKLDWG
jgi:hypothetical protein